MGSTLRSGLRLPILEGNDFLQTLLFLVLAGGHGCLNVLVVGGSRGSGGGRAIGAGGGLPARRGIEFVDLGGGRRSLGAIVHVGLEFVGVSGHIGSQFIGIGGRCWVVRWRRRSLRRGRVRTR